jgi:hypothetical protein
VKRRGRWVVLAPIGALGGDGDAGAPDVEIFHPTVGYSRRCAHV